MPLPKELTTVTPLSKTIALILFILLPILSFFLGMNYQKVIENKAAVTSTPTPGVFCTMEAKICPDGSAVGRSGPNCEFAPCPTLTKTNNQKGFCGGIAGIKCPEGYICQLDGNYPDAAGTCINKTSPVELYECPKGDYVDCMPGPDRLKKTECTLQYLQWAQENCPGFQGAAY